MIACSLLLHLENKSIVKHIIDEIVEVIPLNEPVSLVAGVHGGPAKLVILYLSLHEAPDRTTHNGNRLHFWQQEELANGINLHTIAEELTCHAWIATRHCETIYIYSQSL